MTLVELCAGTASVSLWAMGRCRPLTGFMGSKRRWAGQLVEAMEVDRPERVVLVDAGPWGDVWSVLQASDARAEVAIPGATVYHDPPYLGCPRYAELLPRADVLALAQRWADAGCRVAVSEAEPLPIDGWTARQLARREWVTASWQIRWPEQLSFLEAG